MADKTLAIPTRDLFWRLAGHKYGWAYISRREISVADALVRRGLAEYGLGDGSHDRDHYDCPAVVATEAGRQEIEERWPNSPFALGSYEASEAARNQEVVGG